MKKKYQNTIDDEVIIRYISGNASEHESELIKKWIKEKSENQLYVEEFKKIWNHSGSIEFLQSIDIEEGWKKVKSRAGKIESTEGRLHSEKPKSWLYQFGKIAAVFVLFIATAFLLNQLYDKSAAYELLSFSSPDQKSSLVLSDGTTIFLNKGSTIRYPEKFRRKKREVELMGEAFFEVTPNRNKPFIVSNGDNVSVKVLGTSFNVLSEPENERVTVHVVSGMVSLYDQGMEESGMMLATNEKGIISAGKVEKTAITDMNFISWKTGVLEFENTPLDKVIRKIKRHYNKEIVLELPEPDSILFTSTFTEQSFNEVIEEIILVLGVQYRYQNDTIIIYN